MKDPVMHHKPAGFVQAKIRCWENENRFTCLMSKLEFSVIFKKNIFLIRSRQNSTHQQMMIHRNACKLISKGSIDPWLSEMPAGNTSYFKCCDVFEY